MGEGAHLVVAQRVEHELELPAGGGDDTDVVPASGLTRAGFRRPMVVQAVDLG